MSKFSKYFSSLFLTSVILSGLAACGGGSGDPAVNVPAATSSQAATGSVALLLTDAPSDEFAEINLTVSRVQLLSEERAVTLYEGEKTINLLDLQHHSDLLSWSGDVPAGSYDKIRLSVTDVELVRKDSSGAVLEVIHPKLPGNGKLDLNPRAAFSVNAGGTLMLQIDVDAKKSIHVVKTGNGGYQFRPVVFIDVLGGGLDGKLVRLSGEVRNIDDAARRFDLCHEGFSLRRSLSESESDGDDEQDAPSLEAQGQSSLPAQRCVTVTVAEHGALFNAAGDAAVFADLMENQDATVIGRFSGGLNEDQRLAFSALVVELGAPGSFTRLRGTALSGVGSDGRFTLELADGQGFASGTTLQVVLSEGSKLFSRLGEPLTAQAVTAGVEVKVEGVLQLSDSVADQLKAALVFVDSAQPIDKLSGAISNVAAQTASLNLSDSVLGDRCVTVTEDTALYLITTTPDGYSSAAVTLPALAAGQQAEVYGRYAISGCFVARTVLVAPL